VTFIGLKPCHSYADELLTPDEYSEAIRLVCQASQQTGVGFFFDEPYLGCFGSAYTPINREDVVVGLTELTQEIKSDGVLTGIHCCGNTDWSIFTEIQSLDIISFDAFDFLERFLLYAENIREFLGRKGIICWGIVPTQNFSGKETPQLLTEKNYAGIDVLVKKRPGPEFVGGKPCDQPCLRPGQPPEMYKVPQGNPALRR
jgi:hypothetical protein